MYDHAMSILGSHAPKPRFKKMFSPKARVLVVSAELKCEVGCVADLVRMFSQHGVNVLGFVMQTNGKDGVVWATLLLDLADLKEVPQEPLKRLEYSPKVERIRLVSLPFTINEASFVTLTRVEAEGLRRIIKNLGSGGKAIVFYSGFETGRMLAGRFKAFCEDNRRALENFLLYNESLGYGEFRLEKYLDKAYCRITVERLIECMGVKSSEPNSQTFRGILSGFISSLWGREVNAVETKCIAVGDPYCEFKSVSR